MYCKDTDTSRDKEIGVKCLLGYQLKKTPGPSDGWSFKDSWSHNSAVCSAGSIRTKAKVV